MYPLYNMSLGGRADESAMLGLSTLRVPAKRIIPVILKIIETFKSEKKEGETLDAWIHRVIDGYGGSKIKSLANIKDILKPLVAAPSIEQDKDFYADYGSEGGYHAKTGKGECAA
jgi:sulfite reductase (ferredoxin)